MSKSNNNMFEVRLVTLGDSKVGKTSLILRYVDDEFNLNYLSTMGFDLKIKKIKLSNNKEVKVKIFDTAGQERFKSIASNYLKKAEGIILVYDITDRISFENIDNWVDDINKEGENSKAIILIGNKSDKEDERAIQKEEGEKLAKNCCGGIKFYETSCQTGENVEKAINDLVNDVYNKYSGNISEDKDNNLIIEKGKKGEGNGRKRFC
jgi:Ras-related protein Rab-1A